MCQPIAVDGAWSEWSYWTECNVTCDGGVKNRTRTCDSPQPASNGTDCVGDAVESNSCNYVTCPGMCFIHSNVIVNFKT